MRNKGVRTNTNEDLVHEALIIIYEKYKDIEFDKGILPWAYGVLDKVISGDYRTKNRRENILSNNKNEVLKLHSHYDSIEDGVETVELSDEIWCALNQLNNTQKNIFKLKLEGCSGDEIKDKLKISRSVLDVSVFRGRKKLKKRLEKRGVL